MPMIPEKDQKAIREHFAKKLKQPVAIEYFTQGVGPGEVPIGECRYCRETGALLSELAALSDQIDLRVHDLLADEAKAKEFGITRIPAFVLTGQAKGRVRFLGIPSGYEFAALIEDLVDVSTGQTDLSPKVAEELADLKKDVHIQVFGTPT